MFSFIRNLIGMVLSLSMMVGYVYVSNLDRLRTAPIEPKPNVQAAAVTEKPEFDYRPYGIILLAALLWPFLMIPWMKSALREDSNAATLQALLGIISVPLTAFLLFLLYRGTGGLDLVLQGGIAAIFLFFYTAFILNGIQKKIR